MRNVLWIVAVVLSLGGSANLAMAQSTPGNGITTSSAANADANRHDGEYRSDRTDSR